MWIPGSFPSNRFFFPNPIMSPSIKQSLSLFSLSVPQLNHPFAHVLLALHPFLSLPSLPHPAQCAGEGALLLPIPSGDLINFPFPGASMHVSLSVLLIIKLLWVMDCSLVILFFMSYIHLRVSTYQRLTYF